MEGFKEFRPYGPAQVCELRKRCSVPEIHILQWHIQIEPLYKSYHGLQIITFLTADPHFIALNGCLNL